MFVVVLTDVVVVVVTIIVPGFGVSVVVGALVFSIAFEVVSAVIGNSVDGVVSNNDTCCKIYL